MPMAPHRLPVRSTYSDSTTPIKETDIIAITGAGICKRPNTIELTTTPHTAPLRRISELSIYPLNSTSSPADWIMNTTRYIKADALNPVYFPVSVSTAGSRSVDISMPPNPKPII